MPRKISNLFDIQRGAILKAQGKTFLQIAIALTEDNLNKMTLPDEVRETVLNFNKERTQNDTLTSILKKTNKLHTLDTVTQQELHDKIVGKGRIMHLSKTPDGRNTKQTIRKLQKHSFWRKTHDNSFIELSRDAATRPLFYEKDR